MPISKNQKPYYTDDQYKLARYEASALEYAKAAGYQLIKKGGWWTMKEHDSFVFAPNGMWFWNSHDMKGGAIEFLTQIEHKTMVDAVLTLAGERAAQRTSSATLSKAANEEKPFYGTIEYYGQSGTVVDSIYLDNRPTYLAEIKDSQDVGRTINCREITPEEFNNAMNSGRTVFRYSNDKVFNMCESKFKDIDEMASKLSNPALSKIRASLINGIKENISFVVDFEKAYVISNGFTSAIYESYDYIFDESGYVAHEIIKEAKPFELPPKAENSKRLFAYLCGSRGLDRDIVHDLIKQGKIFESSAGYTKDGEIKTLNNAVFVGFDKDGNARSGFQRGLVTNSEHPFKRDVAGSEKEYAFSIDGKDVDTVAVFEASIDAISHATIAKLSDQDYTVIDRISLGGIAFNALQRYLNDHPNIKNVILCVDADQAGDNAAENLKNELYKAGFTPENGYHSERQIPTGHKDFNEYLISYREALEEQKETESREAKRAAPVEHELDDFYRPEVHEYE